MVLPIACGRYRPGGRCRQAPWRLIWVSVLRHGRIDHRSRRAQRGAPALSGSTHRAGFQLCWCAAAACGCHGWPSCLGFVSDQWVFGGAGGSCGRALKRSPIEEGKVPRMIRATHATQQSRWGVNRCLQGGEPSRRKSNRAGPCVRLRYLLEATLNDRLLAGSGPYEILENRSLVCGLFRC